MDPFSIIAMIGSEFWPYILGAVAFLGVWFGRERAGRKKERAKQKQRNMENYIDTTKRAREAAQDAAREAGQLDDDDLNDRLRDRGALRE